MKKIIIAGIMSKNEKMEKLHQLLVIAISRHFEGIGVKGLLAEPHLALKRRSLQRRLSELVESGKLVVEGKGRALRYKASSFSLFEAVKIEGEKEPRTGAEEEYDPNFLQEYQPNERFYLSESDRNLLRRLGNPIKPRVSATLAQELLHRLLVDLSWASTYLEGGKEYNRTDVDELFNEQFTEGKNAGETLMALNHRAAIEALVADNQIGFDLSFHNLHSILSDGLLPPAACGRTKTPVATDCGDRAEIRWLDNQLQSIHDKAKRITDPFEQSFFVLVHLSYLAPYEGMNGPVSRLAANIPLIRGKLCPLSFVDIPKKHYQGAIMAVRRHHCTGLLREVFLWGYERSCQEYLAGEFESVDEDVFRLQYRAVISKVIKLIVTRARPGTEKEVCLLVPASVPRWSRDRIIATILEELQYLYTGNALRFGLRVGEVLKWEKENKPPSKTPARRL